MRANEKQLKDITEQPSLKINVMS